MRCRKKSSQTTEEKTEQGVVNASQCQAKKGKKGVEGEYLNASADRGEAQGEELIVRETKGSLHTIVKGKRLLDLYIRGRKKRTKGEHIRKCGGRPRASYVQWENSRGMRTANGEEYAHAGLKYLGGKGQEVYA